MTSYKRLNNLGSVFPLHLNWHCYFAQFTCLLILFVVSLFMLDDVLLLLNLIWEIVSSIKFFYLHIFQIAGSIP